MSTPLDDRPGFKESDPVVAALGRLAPATPQIDRDRLMFLAGRASSEPASTEYSVLSTFSRHRDQQEKLVSVVALRRQWLWPAAASVLAATSLALAVALVLRPVPPPQFIVVREPPHASIDLVTEPSPPPDQVVISSPPAHKQLTTAGHLATGTYLRTRDVAFRMGLEALGSPNTASRPNVPTYSQLLHGIVTSAQSTEGGAARGEFLSNM